MKRRMEELKAEVEKEGKKRELAGKKKGEKIGIEKGLKEGEQKRNKEIAKQMLIDGESMEKIIRYTGLTRQWIGRIKRELNKTSYE